MGREGQFKKKMGRPRKRGLFPSHKSVIHYNNKKLILQFIQDHGEQIDDNFVLSFGELYDFCNSDDRCYYKLITSTLELCTELVREGKITIMP